MLLTSKDVCSAWPSDEEGKMFAKFDEIVAKVNDAKNSNDSSGTTLFQKNVITRLVKV